MHSLFGITFVLFSDEFETPKQNEFACNWQAKKDECQPGPMQIRPVPCKRDLRNISIETY
jgi:hypothetical protein